MNKTKRASIGKIGFVLCGALPGFTTYGQPSVSVGVSVGLPSVEIRAASDFYEPLTPYGRWEVVGSYGRCWIPGRVEAGWRPYCNGYWQRTDAGWYWVSDEPWAWATYHYGRWNLSRPIWLVLGAADAMGPGLGFLAQRWRIYWLGAVVPVRRESHLATSICLCRRTAFHGARSPFHSGRQ